MFCPRCGDEGKSDQTSYCSNCGFQTSQIEAFLDTPIKTRKKRSRLRRGLMQSYILFASVVGIFVVGGLLQPLLRTSTRWFVISSLILFLLGVFRLAYAVLFESEFLGRHEDRLESRNTESPNPKQIDGQGTYRSMTFSIRRVPPQMSLKNPFKLSRIQPPSDSVLTRSNE